MSKVKVYALLNQKGGVGKTTTALLLAEGLQAAGKQVLLVDLDQQQNATRQYDVQVENFVTVYDLLTNMQVDAREAIQHTPAFDIIAGDGLIAGIEAEMASMTCRETRLVDALEEVKDDYDYIVIDCSPTLGIVTTNALIAADAVIVPMMCDGYSVDGFNRVAQLVEKVRSNKRLNPSLVIAGFLITQYEAGQRLPRSYDEQLPRLASVHNTKVYKTRIRRCCKTKEAQQLKQSLFAYDDQCTTALDYRAFVAEILEDEING